MADEEKEQPIIVIKKKVISGGHHGGAWKVAYADFVTAMMALFIVLWLLNTSDAGEQVIAMLAEELAGLPNEIVIEGHTDARPFGGRDNYSNWELSADRANSARRSMERHGLRAGQVVQIRGFADQSLRVPDDPNAAANRRISVIVRYRNPPPAVAEFVVAEQEDHGEPLSITPAAEADDEEPAHEEPADEH